MSRCEKHSKVLGGESCQMQVQKVVAMCTWKDSGEGAMFQSTGGSQLNIYLQKMLMLMGHRKSTTREITKVREQ